MSMKVKCFACAALIEADDADAVADAFVAHGQESHTSAYPEEAIRNYACNYASDYGLYRLVDPDGPDPASVIGVSCFVIAAPFRRHGIASALLDAVIADAASRGASWIEGYPHNTPDDSDARHFRGPRSMYDARGFEPVEVREHDTVVRLSAISTRSASHDG